MKRESNVVWHHAAIGRESRASVNGHRPAVVWLTGLSGAGKSTLAHAAEQELHQRSYRTVVLDGDNIRHGLCSDLGFDDADRRENMRRAGEVAKLMFEAGLITFTAFISPFRSDRELVRNLMPHGSFFEIYCRASLAVCEARDVKGLYKRARDGEIKHYTGIDSEYQAPKTPDLIVDTEAETVEESVAKIVDLLFQKNIIPA